MKKLVVLTCTLSILLAAVVLAGCGGGGGSSSETPEQAAKKFFQAYEDKDADTTWALLSADSQKVAKKADWEAFLKQADSVEFTVGKVTVDGDTATAEVTGNVEGEKSTETVPLVKEDGAWKVNMAGISTEQEPTAK